MEFALVVPVNAIDLAGVFFCDYNLRLFLPTSAYAQSVPFRKFGAVVLQYMILLGV